MAFVFVSHAREDKKRIAPHLRRLLKAGIPLWIDRAHELGSDFDQQGRIQLGEAWPSSISRALDECACVLLFWSHDSAGPNKDVLRREANTGLREGKLIQVALDDGAMDKVHDVFSELQAEAFHKLETPEEWERCYKRLEDAIRSKVSAWKRRKRQTGRDIPMCLLPFVVDRQPQVDRICGDLVAQVQRIRGLQQQRGPRVRPVYVLFGRQADCPSRLSERLSQVDGPEVCRDQQHDPWTAWEEEMLLRWPNESSSTPDRVTARFTAAFERHAGRLDRPRCVVAHIDNARRNEHLFVSAWLDLWDEYFRHSPAQPLIPLLTVNASVGWRFWRARRLKRVQDCLQTWQSKATGEHPAIRPVLLDGLSPISYDDAKAWARINFATVADRIAADSFVDKLFRLGRSRMLLAQFATKVRSSEWYKKLAY